VIVQAEISELWLKAGSFVFSAPYSLLISCQQKFLGCEFFCCIQAYDISCLLAGQGVNRIMTT